MGDSTTQTSLADAKADAPAGIDPRIIGTYNGDGSMVSVQKIGDPFPVLMGVIGWGLFIWAACLAIIMIPQYLLNDEVTPSQIRSMTISSAAIGFVVAGAVLHANWYAIAVRLRFTISEAEAAYWQQNKQLRHNCRKPHSTAEFRALLRLAQELDQLKAPEYIAERTSKLFARLADDRGLWSQKASSAWLGPIVLQGIMDAQHPGNDPDDEQSGAAEE